MFGKQKKDSRTYGIIGLGRFGYALASELAEAGAELLVIDRDEEKVRELRDVTENAYVVKNLDKKSLLETGIKNCDVAVVCIGEQMGTSILTTLHLVSIGVPTVIAKANSAEHGEILERLGAEVVYPERDMALRLGKRLVSRNFLDYVSLDNSVEIRQIRVSDKIKGYSIEELGIRPKYNLNIIAIESGKNTNIEVLPGYRLQADDIMVVIGKVSNIDRFEESL